MDAARKELTVRDMVAAQGLARLDLFNKLNKLWDFCEADLEPGKMKPDMRKAALGLQVVKEMHRLFMLDRPMPEEPEPDPDALTPRDRDVRTVAASLLELEQRGER